MIYQNVLDIPIGEEFAIVVANPWNGTTYIQDATINCTVKREEALMDDEDSVCFRVVSGSIVDVFEEEHQTGEIIFLDLDDITMTE